MNQSCLPPLVLVVICLVVGMLVLRPAPLTILPPARAQVVEAQPSLPAMRVATPAVRKLAAAAIQEQLTAFRKGDYQKAVQFQSAMLRQNFPRIDDFRTMMEMSYPQFVHSRKVVFGTVMADASGTHIFVPVSVTGQDGVTVRAAYLMVREGKAYRVEGVVGGARRPLPLSPDAASA